MVFVTQQKGAKSPQLPFGCKYRMPVNAAETSAENPRIIDVQSLGRNFAAQGQYGVGGLGIGRNCDGL